PVAYAIQITDGTLLVEDATTGRVCRLNSLNAQYDCHGTGGALGNGSLAGQLTVAGPNRPPIPAGPFAPMLKPNGDRNELSLQAPGIALATLQPFVNRLAPGSQLSGTLAGNGAATWSANPNTSNGGFTTSGAFAVDQLDAASPALAGDRIRLARIELP